MTQNGLMTTFSDDHEDQEIKIRMIMKIRYSSQILFITLRKALFLYFAKFRILKSLILIFDCFLVMIILTLFSHIAVTTLFSHNF